MLCVVGRRSMEWRFVCMRFWLVVVAVVVLLAAAAAASTYYLVPNSPVGLDALPATDIHRH